VVGGNFGKFDELNVIRQYFTQPNLSPFFCKTRFLHKKFASAQVETGGANSCTKLSILKYLCHLAEAEAKFDPSG